MNPIENQAIAAALFKKWVGEKVARLATDILQPPYPSKPIIERMVREAFPMLPADSLAQIVEKINADTISFEEEVRIIRKAVNIINSIPNN